MKRSRSQVQVEHQNGNDRSRNLDGLPYQSATISSVGIHPSILESKVNLEPGLQPCLEIAHKYNCLDCGLDCSTLAELHTHVDTLHCMTNKSQDVDLDQTSSELSCSPSSSGKIQKLYKKLRLADDKHEKDCKPRPHMCDHCPKTYTIRKHLKEHLERSHTDIYFKCEECGNRYNDSEDLNTHMELHLSGKCFKCMICSTTFKWESSLVGHQLRFHPEFSEAIEEFRCNKCDNSYSTSDLLRKHMTEEHNSESSRSSKAETLTLDIVKKSELKSTASALRSRGQPYKCLACSKSYGSKHGLQHHLDRVHLNMELERKVKCDICGHGSPNQSIAKQHARSHSTETPYQCELCDRAFKYKLGLNRHMDEHNNTKEIFQCALCDKQFKSKLSMETHVNLHTVGDKMKFRCDDCGSTFLYCSTLTRHREEQHLKPKTIQCPQCPQKFATANQLKTHKLKVHTERRFKCDHCERTFIGKYNLGRHLKQSHADVLSELG